MHVIRSADGHETHWDSLVLATGSYPFVPPVKGGDSSACFVYRILGDLDAIAAKTKSARRRVVIGGGLLDLEAVNVLRQPGLETHVIEFAANLMAVQLDSIGAAVLRERIEALGTGVHAVKSTTETEGTTDGLTLHFADGGKLETEMVILPAGIHPQDALTCRSGLDIGRRDGICVDGRCHMSDDAIFAIGRRIPWEGRAFGLVASGYQMVRVVVTQLAGEDVSLGGTDIGTKLRLLGIDIASFGNARARTPGVRSYQWIYGPEQIYKKIVVDVEDKTLLDGVLVGGADDYAMLLQMMLNGMPLPGQPEPLIPPALAGGVSKVLGVAVLSDTTQIRSYHNVSKADICRVVSTSAMDTGAVKQRTKAATGCGGCSALIRQVMEHQLATQGVEVKKDICEHFL